MAAGPEHVSTESVLESLQAFAYPATAEADVEAFAASKPRAAAGPRRRSVASAPTVGLPDQADSQTRSAQLSSRKAKRQKVTNVPSSQSSAPASTTTEHPLEVAESQAPSKKRQPKYRQAKEHDSTGTVEVLCYSCRRTKDTSVQQTMLAFLKKKEESVKGTGGVLVPEIDLTAEDVPSNATLTDSRGAAITVCARCRRPMFEKDSSSKVTDDTLKGTGELPQLQRYRAYKRTSEKQGVPFALTERLSSALMRQKCIACGAPAPLRGHGLTRLRKWPDGLQKPAKGGFMGPYAEGNVAPACTMCNMMKGYRTIRGLVECCRHIATRHTSGEQFGEYPGRFRDNVSKRSRSAYISNSSTHTKTHSLTNEEFNKLVSERCFYCHKEPRAPKTLGPDDRGHFNGLDRLDSTNRLYAKGTVVASCGTCNMMKYRWLLDDFLDHCRKVARFNVAAEFSSEEADDSGAESVADKNEGGAAGDQIDDDASGVLASDHTPVEDVTLLDSESAEEDQTRQASLPS
eukprot:TRINITY_DN114825_c0_g1_i1.p1 TRINITY_DN114825_c0_g1~~TRINITY_DN114825_c0_g1_i1.p1  ORF type:complete len:516 (-),score=62.30 TRINITY_DN114825_c0_g1_i1:660-2207(-)